MAPPIPVDRQWISKLLEKHQNPNSRRMDKALVVAPMVDQSDLPFRMLCRRYGANLCFTPMIHCRLLTESPRYRRRFSGFFPNCDRPLIAQLCGSDPDTVLKAAKIVEPYVDGIDINCGCPQGIAKRGNYGAYLLEQEETLLTLVKHLIANLKVPLSIKVRLLPPVGPEEEDDPNFDITQASLNLYTKLVDAGIHLLTIHGRTRHHKGVVTGHADWGTIRRAVDLLGHRIPIFANGSIQDFDDVEECFRVTGADGIMSSESLLEYPPIFYKIPQTPERTIGRLQLAYEYLELAKQYPPDQGGQGSGMKCMRTHVHRFLHKDLQEDHSLRKLLVCVDTMEGIEEGLQIARKTHEANGLEVSKEELSWYLRHRPDPERDERERLALLVEKEENAWQEEENDVQNALVSSSLFDECGGGDY